MDSLLLTRDRADLEWTDLDRERNTPPALPVDQLSCDSPWCPARVITDQQVLEHAAAGCTACTTRRPCALLQLEAQQPHRHRPRT